MAAAFVAGTPATDRMMSPPSTIGWPSMVTRRVPPRSRRALGHALDEVAAHVVGDVEQVGQVVGEELPFQAAPERLLGEQELLRGLHGDHEAQASLPPDFEMLWLTMPMTSPAALNMGQPELPVLMVASVRKNSAMGIVLYTEFGAHRALMRPALSE
jgi:hypothetical protein